MAKYRSNITQKGSRSHISPIASSGRSARNKRKFTDYLINTGIQIGAAAATSAVSSYIGNSTSGASDELGKETAQASSAAAQKSSDAVTKAARQSAAATGAAGSAGSTGRSAGITYTNDESGVLTGEALDDWKNDLLEGQAVNAAGSKTLGSQKPKEEVGNATTSAGNALGKGATSKISDEIDDTATANLAGGTRRDIKKNTPKTKSEISQFERSARRVDPLNKDPNRDDTKRAEIAAAPIKGHERANGVKDVWQGIGSTVGGLIANWAASNAGSAVGAAAGAHAKGDINKIWSSERNRRTRVRFQGVNRARNNRRA